MLHLLSNSFKISKDNSTVRSSVLFQSSVTSHWRKERNGEAAEERPVGRTVQSNGNKSNAIPVRHIRPINKFSDARARPENFAEKDTFPVFVSVSGSEHRIKNFRPFGNPSNVQIKSECECQKSFWKFRLFRNPIWINQHRNVVHIVYAYCGCRDPISTQNTTSMISIWDALE